MSNVPFKVEALRTRKKQLLERVMDTETYKVAREILQQYAPEQLTPSVKCYISPRVLHHLKDVLAALGILHQLGPGRCIIFSSSLVYRLGTSRTS